MRFSLALALALTAAACDADPELEPAPLTVDVLEAEHAAWAARAIESCSIAAMFPSLADADIAGEAVEPGVDLEALARAGDGAMMVDHGRALVFGAPAASPLAEQTLDDVVEIDGVPYRAVVRTMQGPGTCSVALNGVEVYRTAHAARLAVAVDLEASGQLADYVLDAKLDHATIPSPALMEALRGQLAPGPHTVEYLADRFDVDDDTAARVFDTAAPADVLGVASRVAGEGVSLAWRGEPFVLAADPAAASPAILLDAYLEDVSFEVEQIDLALALPVARELGFDDRGARTMSAELEVTLIPVPRGSLRAVVVDDLVVRDLDGFPYGQWCRANPDARRSEAEAAAVGDAQRALGCAY